MAINLTNLINLDGLRAFKNKNDDARDSAITGALDDYKKHFVQIFSGSGSTSSGAIFVGNPGSSEVISGTGTYSDPYIVDFTVIRVDGGDKKYFRTTSSAKSTASVASTSDIEALFS